MSDVRLIAVDDEEFVLDLYSQVIEGEAVDEENPAAARFRLECFGRGDEAVAAIRAAREEGRPFVAGFFDLRLGPDGPGGPETIRAAREVDPEMLVCVISGAVDIVSEVAPLFRGDEGNWTFLQKPVGVDELRRKAIQMAGQWNAQRHAAVEKSALEGELRIAREKMRQTEALSAIGLVAAGVAHEIKNPLAFIRSNLETLRSYAGRLGAALDAYDAFVAAASGDAKLAAARSALDAARRNARLDFVRADMAALADQTLDGVARVGEITESLKAMSRMSRNDHAVGDPTGCVTSALLLARGELRKSGASVVRNFAPLPPVRFHAGELSQVFVNLLVNAAQALPSGSGTVTVATRTEGGAAVIEVADDGCGIPPEHLQKIFETFFTTKPAGVGTGLGLSISADIVRSHGGAITVESEPGRGTTFRVVLPAAEAGTGAVADATGGAA